MAPTAFSFSIVGSVTGPGLFDSGDSMVAGRVSIAALRASEEGSYVTSM